MPQVIAGQGTDLTKSVAQLVKELLETNWPTTAYDVLKSDIGFGMGSWDDYGDIDIHVNPAEGESETYDIGGTFSKVTDPVVINLYYRKNVEEIPDLVGKAMRKAEEIIKDNMRTLGQGIPMLLWNGWGEVLEDDNLQNVWHAQGRCSAVYWRVKV
jgi:hypothetical protein